MSNYNFFNMIGFMGALSINGGNTSMSNDQYDKHLFDIAMGIDDLIEAGYTKEEIKDVIMKTDFTSKCPTLTKEEVKSLRIEALEILESKYESYLSQTNNEKYTTNDDEKKIKKLKKQLKFK